MTEKYLKLIINFQINWVGLKAKYNILWKRFWILTGNLWLYNQKHNISWFRKTISVCKLDDLQQQQQQKKPPKKTIQQMKVYLDHI